MPGQEPRMLYLADLGPIEQLFVTADLSLAAYTADTSATADDVGILLYFGKPSNRSHGADFASSHSISVTKPYIRFNCIRPHSCVL